jgi:type IV pilus assembly protein PilW
MKLSSDPFTVNRAGALQEDSLAIVGDPGSGQPCILFRVNGVEAEKKIVPGALSGAPDSTDVTDAPLFTSAGDIVQMKAQYGISNDATSSVVDDWVNAIGSWAVPIENPNKIKAVRVVIVARSGEPASTNVSAACTNDAGIANTGPCSFQDAKAPVIDLSAVSVPAGMTWQRYRYRVHQTVIPLRNLTWNDK